jgi:hypothetical protein
MFSKEKTRTTFLRLAGASLGVLLVVVGGTFAPRPSPTAPPTEMALAATPALDSTCQTVIDASAKLFNMPFHFYFTDTGADGKSTTMESIFVDGAAYTPVRGKWFRMPLSSMDTKDMVQLSLKDAKNWSCHVLRDESVNGESATVYRWHDEGPRGTHDAQVWISKSKGVLLREESDAQKPGESGKGHVSVRFDYNNVQAPKVWEPLPQF